MTGIVAGILVGIIVFPIAVIRGMTGKKYGGRRRRKW